VTILFTLVKGISVDILFTLVKGNFVLSHANASALCYMYKLCILCANFACSQVSEN